MMDPVTLLLLGAGAQAVAQLGVMPGRWLTLRARADLARAASDLPAGTRVCARDAAGTWSVDRTPARRPR